MVGCRLPASLMVVVVVVVEMACPEADDAGRREERIGSEATQHCPADRESNGKQQGGREGGRRRRPPTRHNTSGWHESCSRAEVVVDTTVTRRLRSPRHNTAEHRVLFTYFKKTKIFQDSPSPRIFRRMYEVLNIDENKN
jgi:hypothetical protein